MSHFLLQQQPELGKAALLDGIRMVYTLKNKSLELSFRKDVQNIKVDSYPNPLGIRLMYAGHPG